MPDTLALKPQVSVIMITYNRGHLLEESVRSVIEQTYENLELVIVDDGSEDDTSEVVQKLKNPKIKYYRVDHCGKLGKLRNIGIEMARGEYIAFQDSDDLWLPKKLEVQIDLLKKYPNAAFVLSNSSQFGENATPVPDYDSLYVGNLFLPILKDRLFHFCGTSLLFKKSVICKVGLLEEEIRMMRELHFFLRMSAIYEGVFTNERLVSVRRHPSNTSNFYRIEGHETSIDMFNEFLNKGFLTRKVFKVLTSECFYKIGIAHLKERRPSSAVNAFYRSTLLNPLNWRNSLRFSQALVFSTRELLNKTTAASRTSRK